MPYVHDPRQIEGSDFVCAEHVGDARLASLISEQLDDDPEAGEKCALCDEQGMAVVLVVEEIDAAVVKFYERASDAGVPWDDGDWALPVWSTEEVLSDVGVDGDSPLLTACLEAIEYDAWVPRGDPLPGERALLQAGWDNFREHVKHRSRFLFGTVDTERHFGVVETFGTHDFLDELLKVILQRQPKLVLDQEIVIYRARAFSDIAKVSRSAEEYTSPPSDRATQGRMNPAGIAYFYGALEEDTAAIEVYDGSSYAAVASFQPTRELILLDLRDSSIPSPFDRSVTLEEHQRAVFLSGFTREIRRPIVKDDRIHQEYVPTQAVTEYLRFRSPSPIDGVAYSSARAAGTNLVVFASQDECLPSNDSALLVPRGDFQLFEYGPPAMVPRGARKFTTA